MAQFNRLSLGRKNFELLDEQTVFVTHVESPSLFFCRLTADDTNFRCLQQMIADAVVDDRHLQIGDTTDLRQTVLVYSDIRKCWCRARILSRHRGSIVKVFLVDYGSIDLIVSNDQYIQHAPDDIVAFNDGYGFCFPCKLDGILPFDDMKSKTTSEWSSYANFVMERETKDREFLLTLRRDINSHAQIHDKQNGSNNIIVCDLQYQCPDGPANARSTLASTLVNANVAHFNNTERNAIQTIVFRFDDNKENEFIIR